MIVQIVKVRNIYIIIKGLKESREIVVASWDAMGTALTGLGSALSKIGD